MYRNRRGIALVVYLLIGAAVGCFPMGPSLGDDCPPVVAGQQRLVVRGDSLAAMAESIAKPLLKESHGGKGPVCYVAQGMTQLDHHLEAFAQVDPTDCAIVELGTNDGLKDLWEVILADMHAVADELADADTQVWFTLNETGADMIGFPYDVRAHRFNDELLRMNEDRERWPNLVVWRWDLESLGHPEWLNLPDKLHYNSLGTTRYAQSLVSAAAACPGITPPPTTSTLPPLTTVPPETSTSTTSTTGPDATTTTTGPEATDVPTAVVAA